MYDSGMHTKHVKKVTPAFTLERRIKNVQGQLDGVLRMIDSGATCTDTMAQFKAAHAGLERAFALFLEENLTRCMASRIDTSHKKEFEHILAELVK